MPILPKRGRTPPVRLDNTLTLFITLNFTPKEDFV